MEVVISLVRRSPANFSILLEKTEFLISIDTDTINLQVLIITIFSLQKGQYISARFFGRLLDDQYRENTDKLKTNIYLKIYNLLLKRVSWYFKYSVGIQESLFPFFALPWIFFFWPWAILLSFSSSFVKWEK